MTLTITLTTLWEWHPNLFFNSANATPVKTAKESEPPFGKARFAAVDRRRTVLVKHITYRRRLSPVVPPAGYPRVFCVGRSGEGDRD